MSCILEAILTAAGPVERFIQLPGGSTATPRGRGVGFCGEFGIEDAG